MSRGYVTRCASGDPSRYVRAVNLEDCLPAELRGPTTTITPIAAGMSGAGVYRVEAGARAFVLKIAAGDDPVWRRKLHVQQLAAARGLAPAVIHVDEARRAVVSAFVVDRGFAPLVMTPATRERALDLLGKTLRRVHELPVPQSAPAADPRQALAGLSATATTVPVFAAELAARVLAETPPPADRPLALSHNDVNPSNVVHDGERILLLDWDVAGPNDPLYDLATIALFLRFDEAACLRLLAAHDGAPVAALPARFGYLRRVVGALVGTMMLVLARQGGHAGGETDAPLSLAEYYQRMRAGQVSPATPAGKWQFGLALLAETSAR